MSLSPRWELIVAERIPIRRLLTVFCYFLDHDLVKVVIPRPSSLERETAAALWGHSRKAVLLTVPGVSRFRRIDGVAGDPRGANCSRASVCGSCSNSEEGGGKRWWSQIIAPNTSPCAGSAR